MANLAVGVCLGLAIVACLFFTVRTARSLSCSGLITTQFYVALLLLSPKPINALPSEKKFRSAKFPDEPQSLPDITTSAVADVDLSIIIPAFNEVPRLPSMLASTVNHLASRDYRRRTREILIVDDGSSDGTADIALSLAQKYAPEDIRVISLERNLGKGGAVRHGMLHSRGRRLLMVDADGASRFEDLEMLWKEMDKAAPTDEPAVVVGSRAHLVNTEAVVKVRVDTSLVTSFAATNKFENSGPSFVI